MVQAAILPNGNVGFGTPGDANGIPTATDRLQVFGDIRVGTSGTNGCLKNFAGTGIVGHVRVRSPLQEKHHAVRPRARSSSPRCSRCTTTGAATNFPSVISATAQTYGLIAQDVEQVLPELVVTDDDGYKAIDYSKLPLLTIQAVKELKAENDALKAENDALKQRVAELEPLKQRVAELERLLTEMLASRR